MNLGQTTTLAFGLLGTATFATAAPFPATFDASTIDAAQGRTIDAAPRFAGLGPDDVGSFGDVDGDGRDDLQLFADRSRDGFADTHLLLFGSEAGGPLEIGPLALQPDDGIALENLATHEGPDLGAAGDVDGDGLADWWAKTSAELGVPDELFLVYGREGRYAVPFAAAALGAGERTRFVDSRAETLLYREAHAVGDYNGDGFDDLVFRTTGLIVQSEAELRLVYGSAGGLPAVVDVGDLPPEQVMSIRATDGLAGPGSLSPSVGGDVNGDDLADLVLVGEERVAVLFGGLDGLPPDAARATLEGGRGFNVFANAARVEDPSNDVGTVGLVGKGGLAGDLNGDGLDDLLVPTNRRGETFSTGAHIVYGSREGSTVVLETLDAAEGFEARFDIGERLNDGVEALNRITGVGDIDGDGFDDWLIGDAIVYGRASGPSFVALSDLDGLNGFRAAEGIARLWPAGDFNGDGLADLFFGSWGNHDAYLVFGRASDEAPASPRDLRAALGAGLIEIHWTASASEAVVAYRVSRDGVPLAEVGADTSRFEDRTARADELYSYAVLAVDETGAVSAPVTLDVIDEATRYPVLSGLVYSDTLAELFWVHENVEYRVYRDGIEVDRRYASSYVDRDYDTAGHDYVVEVVPQPGSRTTVRSATLRLPEGAGGQPPSPPARLEVARYSPTTLALAWPRVTQGVAPFTHEVFRDGELLGTTAGTNFIDRSLPAVERFALERENLAVYRVVTLDANGVRSNPRSLSVDLNLNLLKVLPAAPASTSWEAVSARAASVTWRQGEIGTAPSGYEIRVNGVRRGTTPDTAYTVEDLIPGRGNEITITGYDEAGRRSPSRTVSVRLAAVTPPLDPPTLRVAIYSPTAIELFWERELSPAVRVSRWELYRDGERVQGPFGTSAFDDTLEPGVTYDYRVRYIFENGDEIFSVTRSVSTTGRPSAPDGVSARVADGGTVELRWNRVRGAERYNVYRDGRYLASVDDDDRYLDTAPPAVDGLRYSVVAVDEDRRDDDRFSEPSAAVGVL